MSAAVDHHRIAVIRRIAGNAHHIIIIGGLIAGRMGQHIRALGIFTPIQIG